MRIFATAIRTFVVQPMTRVFKDSDGINGFRSWWLNRDKSRQALAVLDDDQICNLSEFGRQIRREARRAKNKR